jgi:uncharacterized membrane protein YfcA
MIVDLLLFLLIGAIAGFLAGLLGIGGGLVIVPVLAWLLLASVPEHAMHLAVATSLGSIVFTSVSSLLAHHRHGAVLWQVVSELAPGLVLGSLAGALFAARLSGQALILFFACFCMLAGTHLLRRSNAVSGRGLPGRAGYVGAGMGIGVLSAMVGIGGGTLTVPWLLWRGTDIHRSVATAAACGLPIAAAAVIGYVYAGWSRGGLPAGSAGFVHLPALAGISVASVIAAPWGARLAHRTPRQILQRVFGGFLLLLSVYFAWRGFIVN